MHRLADQVHIAIMSYGRAGDITTLKFAPYASIWVPESQGAAYSDAHGSDHVITIPDHMDGDVAKKRNAIMDACPTPRLVLLDDDIVNLGYFEAGLHFDITPEYLLTIIERHFDLADQLGVALWGVNQNKDPLIHYTYRPFSLLAPILGPFSAHILTDLRYDPYMIHKSDYDFWLRTINKYRKTLRANKYHYLSDHGKKKGGNSSIRTMAREKEGINRLLTRYGKRLIRPGGSAGGKSATGENILNTRIQINIPGT